MFGKNNNNSFIITLITSVDSVLLPLDISFNLLPLLLLGPKDRLFTRFQEAWRFLGHNENELNLWDWPEDPNNYRHERGTEVRGWLERMMRQGVFDRNRDDYRELMECAAKYLGAQVKNPF